MHEKAPSPFEVFSDKVRDRAFFLRVGLHIVRLIRPCKTRPCCANLARIPPVTLITARLHLPFASSDLPMLLVSSESAGFLPFSAIPPHLQAIPSHLRRRIP